MVLDELLIFKMTAVTTKFHIPLTQKEVAYSLRKTDNKNESYRISS